MVHRLARGATAAFTRVELIVIIAIVVLPLGVLSSWLFAFREGDTFQCRNNLKQLSFGAQAFHDVHKRLPPLFAGGTDLKGNPISTLSEEFAMYNGAPHVLILPYVEQEELFKRLTETVNERTAYIPAIPTANPVNQTPIVNYICPIDPSYFPMGIQLGSGLAGTSYAANGQLFGKTDSATGQPVGERPWDRAARWPDIKDGLSNTVLFAHAYARCGAAQGDDRTPASGAVWGYYNNGLAPSGNQGPPIFMNAVLSGNANVGEDIKVAFQVKPLRYHTAAGCDPRLPATPHRFMLVVLADGSVRGILPDVRPQIWWQACSPDDGSNLPEDWAQ